MLALTADGAAEYTGMLGGRRMYTRVAREREVHTRVVPGPGTPPPGTPGAGSVDRHVAAGVVLAVGDPTASLGWEPPLRAG